MAICRAFAGAGRDESCDGLIGKGTIVVKKQDKKWYLISNKKLFLILGISLLWIIAGIVLYITVGAEHGPSGGLDSIAEAIVYVFFWQALTYGPPLLASAVTLCLWLWQHHRKVLLWIALGIVALAVLSAVYQRFFRKLVHTPKYEARQISSYEDWKVDWNMGGLFDYWTESDLICEYAGDVVSEATAAWRDLYPEEDIDRKEAYIDAAMEAHYRELPGVTGWEYLPDVTELLTGHGSDTKYLLDHEDFLAVAEHYGRPLNLDHWRDVYEYDSAVVAEYYSWLPMMVIFYEDGTMDLIVAAG